MIGNFLTVAELYFTHNWNWKYTWEIFQLNSSTELSTGIVSSVQLWAKETGILSGTNNGMVIHIFNAVASDWSLLDLDHISYRKLVEIGFEKMDVWPAIIVSGTYVERFQPAGTKSKETPGEENAKILKSGSKDHNVGVEWLDRWNSWSTKIEWYAKNAAVLSGF